MNGSKHPVNSSSEGEGEGSPPLLKSTSNSIAARDINLGMTTCRTSKQSRFPVGYSNGCVAPRAHLRRRHRKRRRGSSHEPIVKGVADYAFRRPFSSDDQKRFRLSVDGTSFFTPESDVFQDIEL
ncbi:hypothetical protein AVEN_60274-1 [Araneus ventricosus]|uniref:Uncharacterized protein n=1 Tax=Araneus ventricosus TaxID=182803 RepID=A0A4Y2CYT3_ARAVE|nr:hypothetical protein AVEN_60274-1 [Araneus ventricosus]